MASDSNRILIDCKKDNFAKYGLRELSGHTRKVLTVAWNKDGRRLASGALDKTIRIWTVEPSTSVSKPEKADYEFRGDKGSMDAVTCIDWKPDHPDVLASTSATKTDTYVRFHDARTQKPINALALNSERNMCVSWSPDGNSLVVTCSNNDLVFIDHRKLKKYKQWTFQNGNVNEAAWGPTPDRITMAVDDGTVRIVAANRLEVPLWKLQSHLGGTNTFRYSAGQKWLATGGQDGIVSLWDADDMICVKTFLRPDHPVRSVSFSHDAKWLSYSSEDGMIDVVSTQPGELACSIAMRTFADSVAWSPSHHVLAFAGEELTSSRDVASNATICIWAPPK